MCKCMNWANILSLVSFSLYAFKIVKKLNLHSGIGFILITYIQLSKVCTHELLVMDVLLENAVCYALFCSCYEYIV